MPSNRLRIVVLGVAAGLLGACGGSDGESVARATASPTAVSHDAFCRSAVQMEEAVFRAATGGSPGPIEPLVTDVEESAPEELEGEVDAVVSAVRQTLEEGDDA